MERWRNYRCCFVVWEAACVREFTVVRLTHLTGSCCRIEVSLLLLCFPTLSPLFLLFPWIPLTSFITLATHLCINVSCLITPPPCIFSLLYTSGERFQVSHCVIRFSLDAPRAAESEKRDGEKSQVGEKWRLTVRWALAALWPGNRKNWIKVN